MQKYYSQHFPSYELISDNFFSPPTPISKCYVKWNRLPFLHPPPFCIMHPSYFYIILVCTVCIYRQSLQIKYEKNSSYI